MLFKPSRARSSNHAKEGQQGRDFEPFGGLLRPGATQEARGQYSKESSHFLSLAFVGTARLKAAPEIPGKEPTHARGGHGGLRVGKRTGQ